MKRILAIGSLLLIGIWRPAGAQAQTPATSANAGLLNTTAQAPVATPAAPGGGMNAFFKRYWGK